MGKLKGPLIKIILSAIGLTAACFITYKAHFSSFTHDEAFTFLVYTKKTYKFIITNALASANNHILNSLLTKTTSIVLGETELSLRLPNVIAGISFIYLFLKWFLKTPKPLFIGIWGFSLLFLNNQVFEFYSLSRGYGLSFLFLSLSIYFFHKGIKKNSNFSSFKIFLFFGANDFCQFLYNLCSSWYLRYLYIEKISKWKYNSTIYQMAHSIYFGEHFNFRIGVI